MDAVAPARREPQPAARPSRTEAEPQEPGPAPAASADEAAEEQQAITVTGTRISGFTAPTPVTSLNQADLQAKAASTVADLLDDVPQLRINQNIGKSSEPVGASNADLRGLGTQRTLLLIDGRRVAFTDPAGTIDTNIVPVALISSIEIVTGGASAAYGSDAVAGVVNFMLDKNLKGLKLDLSYGESVYDDHHRPAISAAYGIGLLDDRLHLTVAADYMHNDGQTAQGTRPWGDDKTALLTNPAYTATNGQPRLLIANNSRFTQMTAGGVLTRAIGLQIAQRLGFPAGTGVQFGPGGTVIPFNYGTNIGGTYMTGGDGATLVDEGNILPEIERITGYAGMRYELSDKVTMFADFLYSRVNVLSDLSPNRDDAGFTVRNDNAYLPSAVRIAMAAQGVSSITVGRMNFEDQTSLFDNATDVKRLTFGLEGSFGNGWRWDVSAQISRNSYESISYYNRIANRWTLGLDAVTNPATGQPICRALLNNPNPTAAQDPYGDIRNCVPINPFGAGSINQAALNYYRGTSWTRSRQEQDVFAANLSGSPFRTWAGDVKFAVGAEYRREKTSLTSDADSALRRWRSINSQPFAGEFTVKEGYAEVVVPLANGVAWADNLDLNGAIRYTDYELSGGVTTWKVGASYSPVPDLRFRATLSRDIRAPNNYELFQRGNQVISAIVDPRTNISRPTLQITSGNTALVPERADTLTAGVIFQPGFLPGLRASIDYYRIAIKQAISTIAPQSIVDYCNQGRTEFCSGVVRDPATQNITQINVIPFNADSLKTSGVDVELQYRFQLFGGQLSLRGLANYVAEISTTSNGITNDFVGLVGLAPPPVGLPEWRFNLDANYAVGPWKLGVGYRYVDGGKFDTRFNITTLDLIDNTVPGRGYVDLNASYKLNSAVELYGRVENLFNVDPPITPNSIATPTVANSPFYDRRGAYFVIGGRIRL
ncbi:TonB-dependent receptor [Sphingomonas turrisvirgatae]|uniref:TonB-dependent receptor n=1 Tax=Sphingomonas turrisvirgatae TaxID=1888892 RepID=A0A1E3LRK3_9SPHN|nr:TonB-dependent receptor [Sphingomonas turrisvirgatae]